MKTKLIGGPRAGHWVECDEQTIRFSIQSDGPPLFPFMPELKPHRMHTYRLAHIYSQQVYVHQSMTLNEAVIEMILSYKP